MASKVTAYAKRAAESIDQKLTDQEEKNDQYVSQMFDQVKIASVKKVLRILLRGKVRARRCALPPLEVTEVSIMSSS